MASYLHRRETVSVGDEYPLRRARNRISLMSVNAPRNGIDLTGICRADMGACPMPARSGEMKHRGVVA